MEQLSKINYNKYSNIPPPSYLVLVVTQSTLVHIIFAFDAWHILLPDQKFIATDRCCVVCVLVCVCVCVALNCFLTYTEHPID